MAAVPQGGGIHSLSSELVEAILSATLDSTHELNLSQLRVLQSVCSAWIDPARRLLFRHLVVQSGRVGRALLLNLLARPHLGAFARSLTIKVDAYGQEFSDITADDILRRLPNLTNLDTRMGHFSAPSGGYGPVAVYPSSLRHFRFSLTAQEVADHSNFDDEDDSDSSDDEGPVSALERLSRLKDLPTQLRSLQFEGQTIHPRTLPPTQDESFPLRSLAAIEIIHTDLPSSFFPWIIDASAAELKRLKLWGNPLLSKKDTTEILETIGSQLDEFLFKPAHSDPTVLPQLLQHCTSLKKLTIGPGASSLGIYSAITTPFLTHLCVNIPSSAIFLHTLQALLTTGNLRTVRRLELYSLIYFPPPLDITYLDDISAPATQLRELRLSHVVARPSHLLNLLTAVGPGLRTLAIHHVGEKLGKLVKLCPNLLRLEIGVALEPHSGAKRDFFKNLVAPRLHLLRIHFQSGIELEHIVGAVRRGPLAALRELDLTGLFPSQVERSWTGTLLDELVGECAKRGIRMSLNGHGLRTPGVGQLWTAVLEYARALDS